MNQLNFKISQSIKVFFKKIKEKSPLSYFKFFKKNDHVIGKQQLDLDKKLVYSLSKSRIPSLQQIKYLKKFLSKKELWMMRVSIFVFFASFIFLGISFYFKHLKVVPVSGGEYVEGLVGVPQYINPLYMSRNDVDNDIGSLIFSSLFKRDKNGELKNDLALSVEPDADGKAYIVKIRRDVLWQNNSHLTVDDIVFTFNAIKNAQYHSPLRDDFRGVEIEKVDDDTVKFKLSEVYAAFKELLTFYIMPQDSWGEIPPQSVSLAELNTKPIGSGLYQPKSFKKTPTGQMESYSVAVNDNYYGNKPYITDVTFKFFSSFEEAVQALNDNKIDGISYLPKQIEDKLISKNSLQVHKLNLPQLSAIFLNQKDNVFLSDKVVRKALALATDRNTIIQDILKNDANAAFGPILPSNFAYNSNIDKYEFNKDGARQILNDAGWQVLKITSEDIDKAKENLANKDEKIKKSAEDKVALGVGEWRGKDGRFIHIKITTIDTEENSKIAQYVKKSWEDLNIKVEINIVPTSQIVSSVIRPRNFDALIYSQIVDMDPDVYAFWHSSQISENGLNIANYSNKDADKLLEEGRLSVKLDERIEKYKKFQEIINDDAPAIFLYSPHYTYVQTKKIKGFDINNIQSPANRFSNISDWHIKTKQKIVW